MTIIREENHNHDRDYNALLDTVHNAFKAAQANGPLFCTNVEGMNMVYLDNLPAERQMHNCSCCRRFIETYGGLVTIDEKGLTHSAMWATESAPEFYRGSFAALEFTVRKARVTGLFVTKEKLWGNPKTGEWTHMHVLPPLTMVYKGPAKSASEHASSVKERYRIVATALTEFTAPMLDQAIRLLEADTLARSEKFLAPVQWLRALHDRPKGPKGENVLWRAVATAPEGYCHPKSSVIGPLLGDIAAGLQFDVIKRKFDAMMHPLRYQRPQAAPTEGNIKAAEALVEKLGIKPSLERRFARLEDLEALWTPKKVETKDVEDGVFSHLKAKSSRLEIPSVSLPQITMTWEKFARTVLPDAGKIEVMAPARGDYVAMTAPMNADAPAIMKWDNGVGWYRYHDGSEAMQFKVIPGWASVTAICMLPPHWGENPKPYLGDGGVVIIEGAVDTRTGQGNALFPECLRDDLHGARATIEAYSKGAKIEGLENASACGLGFGKKGGVKLRVAGTVYNIDRWD